MKIKLGKLEFEVKELPFRLYDKNGKEIYYCDSTGFELWREYDENGNQTYARDSEGYEWWREYDADGDLIYCHHSKGYEWGTPRSKSLEGKVVEIDGKKYRLKEVKK